MESREYYLPSFWSSYLINGNSSGMEDEEKEAIDRWIADNKCQTICITVSEESSFRHLHDASAQGVLPCDCSTYVFH